MTHQIRTARRMKEQQRMLERQRRLAGLAVAISARIGLKEILRRLRDAVVEAGDFDRAAVFLLDQENDALCGTWGTDRQGRPEDLSDVRYDVNAPTVQSLWQVVRGKVDYDLTADFSGDWNLPPSDPMFGVRSHAALPLRADNSILGVLCVDNLLHGAPITEEDVEGLLPFCAQGAVAIQNAHLMAEHERHLKRQRRLMEISAAINASLELDDVLRLVRDAIVEAGGFERASVWTIQEDTICGAWGTDGNGCLRDERHIREKLEWWGPNIQALLSGQQKYYVEEWFPADLPPDGQPPKPITHGVLPLRAGGELVGMLSVDNMLSDRHVTEEDIVALLPFAEQAAVAIRNARLQAERARHLERQRCLASLAAAINAHTSLTDILRMVRDAAVEVGGFDRAAIFLYDRESDVARGTWGTDRAGNREDTSYALFHPGPQDDDPMVRVLRGVADYMIVTDYTAERGISPSDPMHGVRMHAVLPLRAEAEILGALAVDNLLRDAPITTEDIEGLLPFADQAAVAIQNARLFEQLHQAQEALVRSEKMRALGELASGVAHNINNLLTAVIGYAELIQQDSAVTPEIAHFARIIERAGLDGAEIVRRVQQFARKETATGMEPFDLAGVVREALDLTRPTWRTQAEARGTEIKLVVDMPAQLPCFGTASEIREVIVNLIGNAADAMPEGGTLTIRGRLEVGGVAVEVRDTGTGMDDATRRRIFEPFFTTKGTALGTGLGLSLAWGILQRHDGRIEVESAPGQGSAFTIYLPIPSETMRAESPKVEDVPRASAHTLPGARLLLVEDEEFVAESLARILIRGGATVEMTANAEEALEWLEAHGAACDLIVSDHGMPGLTGLELLARVRHAYPHIRRVLLSGWGDSPPGAADVAAAELILSKPVRQHELLDALSGLLKEEG